MKVSSPVGEFSSEPRSLRVEEGGLVIEGAMGVWPATIRVQPSGLLSIVRLMSRPLVFGIGWALAYS